MTRIQSDPDGVTANERLLGTPNRGPRRTVLILGGGGMRGMAHVGVLRALATLGIRYDAVIGTSIGALIGAMSAAGVLLAS